MSYVKHTAYHYYRKVDMLHLFSNLNLRTIVLKVKKKDQKIKNTGLDSFKIQSVRKSRIQYSTTFLNSFNLIFLSCQPLLLRMVCGWKLKLNFHWHIHWTLHDFAIPRNRARKIHYMTFSAVNNNS